MGLWVYTFLGYRPARYDTTGAGRLGAGLSLPAARSTHVGYHFGDERAAAFEKRRVVELFPADRAWGS